MRDKLANELDAEQILRELVGPNGNTPPPEVDTERRGTGAKVVAKRVKGNWQTRGGANPRRAGRGEREQAATASRQREEWRKSQDCGETYKGGTGQGTQFTANPRRAGRGEREQAAAASRQREEGRTSQCCGETHEADKQARDLDGEQILEELVDTNGNTPPPQVDKDGLGAKAGDAAKRTRVKLADDLDGEQIPEELVESNGNAPPPKVDKERRGARTEIVWGINQRATSRRSKSSKS